MKNLQIRILKIITAFAFFFSFYNSAAAGRETLRKADSLFKAKQYVQSLEIYNSIFSGKKYSPAMLLKMAFINEGLGKIGATLYSLKLYHLITQDEQVEKKMEELATKFKLGGYEASGSNNFSQWLSRKIILVQALLLILISGFTIVILFLVKKERKPWGMVPLVLLSIGVLIFVTDFHSTSNVIVANDQTYLMDGPSAGANVSAVIGEGNLLQSIGHEDVWIKVRWLDKIVYVKENAVLKIEI